MANPKKICNRLIQTYPKEVDAIFLLEDLYIIFASSRKNEIKNYLKKAGLISEVILSRDCFNEFIKGEKNAYLTLAKSQVIYDPEHFFSELKETVVSGDVFGTEEFLVRSFRSINKHFEKVESVKLAILENLYTAVIDSAQAFFIQKKGIYPRQMQIVKLIEKEFALGKEFGKRYSLKIKEILKTLKKVEHGKISSINGVDLEIMSNDAQRFIDVITELLDK